MVSIAAFTAAVFMSNAKANGVPFSNTFDNPTSMPTPLNSAVTLWFGISTLSVWLLILADNTSPTLAVRLAAGSCTSTFSLGVFAFIVSYTTSRLSMMTVPSAFIFVRSSPDKSFTNALRCSAMSAFPFTSTGTLSINGSKSDTSSFALTVASTSCRPVRSFRLPFTLTWFFSTSASSFSILAFASPPLLKSMSATTSAVIPVT